MKKREVALIVGGIAFLSLITSLSLLLGDRFQVQSCGCPKMVSQHFIWLFIFLAIIFVASLLYYLFSLKIDEKERCLCKNMEILNSILDKDEKRVVDKIALSRGEIEQTKISEMYDKIKAHRIIKKLQEKGMIEIKKKGKTNTIRLKEELIKELVK